MPLQGHRGGPDGLAERVGDNDVAQIITVDFPARKVIDWGTDRFAEAARRCEAEALLQPDRIADALRRCAAKYRAAEGGGG
jgi:hypothetical protein